MKIISHRGYLNGKDDYLENNPKEIIRILENTDFDIEVDLWTKDLKWYFGHDYPKYELSSEEIILLFEYYFDRVWIHCKNFDALDNLSSSKHYLFKNLNYFWHQEDDFTLTSKQYIWCYPGKFEEDFFGNMVCLDFDLKESEEYYKNLSVCAICTDYPKKLKEILNKKD